MDRTSGSDRRLSRAQPIRQRSTLTTSDMVLRPLAVRRNSPLAAGVRSKKREHHDFNMVYGPKGLRRPSRRTLWDFCTRRRAPRRGLRSRCSRFNNSGLI
jgi:hypothetical protein